MSDEDKVTKRSISKGRLSVPRHHDPRHFRYTTGRWPSRTRPDEPAPVETRKPDLAAWRAALDLTEGDTSRLTVEADGSVTIHNHPIR